MFKVPSSPTTQATNSFQTSAETLTVQSSPRSSHRSFHMGNNGEAFFGKPPMSPGVHNVNSFKGSPVSPYKGLNFGQEGAGGASRLSPESPTRSPQLPRDLESPYRLSSNRSYDPESPYRLRESPYGRVMVTPSPFYQELQRSLKTGTSQDLPPYPGSPESSGNRTMSSVPDSPSRASRLPRATTDTQHSFRALSDFGGSKNPVLPTDEPSAFTAMGDSLYKRPSSPVSPMPSSRRSSDSLHRSPSTPRASPLVSRRRIESSFKTPPLTRSKRSFTENSCYEYD